MPNELLIIRVDPEKKIVTAMKMRAGGGNLAGEVARICRVKAIGHRVLMEIDHEPIKRQVLDATTKKPAMIDSISTKLVVAAGAEISEAVPSWRIRGGDGTSGIGALFGIGPGGGMVDAPITAEWLRERILWEEGETQEQLEERARDLIPLLDEPTRAAIQAAIPDATGGMLVPFHLRALWPALLALGVTEGNGNLLTGLGVAVHFALIEEAVDVA